MEIGIVIIAIYAGAIYYLTRGSDGPNKGKRLTGRGGDFE